MIVRYLLVIFVVGLKNESLTTEAFADLKSCNNAGKSISAWINDNDARWSDSTKFTCIKVTGK